MRTAAPTAHIIAADFCVPILSLTPPSIAHRVAADGLRLPFHDASFDAFTIAFGIRNFSDPARGLGELHRILKPGGRGLILEFFQPESSITGFFYSLYLRTWIPLIGGIISGSFTAYSHLTNTIHTFATRPQFSALAQSAGFTVTSLTEFSFGASTAVLLQKHR